MIEHAPRDWRDVEALDALGTPRALFRTVTRNNTVGRQYDVSPDGKRFLMCEPVSFEESSPIVVVVPGTGAAAR